MVRPPQLRAQLKIVTGEGWIAANLSLRGSFGSSYVQVREDRRWLKIFDVQFVCVCVCWQAINSIAISELSLPFGLTDCRRGLRGPFFPQLQRFSSAKERGFGAIFSG